MLWRVHSNILVFYNYIMTKSIRALFYLNVSRVSSQFMRDHLQYHLPFALMLVYQVPLLLISAEIYYEKDTNICWERTLVKTGGPSTGREARADGS